MADTSFSTKYSSSDVEGRAALLTSLASSLSQNEPPQDLEQYVAALSDSLHSPHHALPLASLKALPAFFRTLEQVGPSAATERTLKQAVKSCLAQHGNLVDKLGDPKIVIREAARATLLDASTCSLSFISSLAHAPVDHPAQLIDKAIREHGFGSKNPRIRESSLQYLTSLRTSSTLRMEQLPTLKPYFQLLMHTLEDSDPTVREAAKESTVAIFSAPGLSDAARAELKKELGKGNVRKSTADHVLNKIFNGSSTSKDPPTQTDPDASEAPPPSMAGTSAGTVLPSEDVPPLYIASVRDLEGEFQQMLAPFEGKETEHNWQSRDRSIGKIRGMLRGDVISKYGDAFIRQVRQVSEGIARCMMSLRTTLAVSAVYLVAELAQALRSLMDPLFDTFSSTLQKLASGTKKLLVAASEAAMTSLLTNCSCIPKMCQMLLSGISEKSPTARSAIATQLPIMIKAHAQQDKAAFEYSGSMELLEKSIRKALSDPTPSVRDKGRMAFWEFYEVWTTDADRIAASLDPQARSQLEKARLKANGPLAKTASSSNLVASNISRPDSSASARPSVRQMIAARKAAAARGDNNGVKEQSKDHGPASSSQHASVLAQKSPKAASPPPSTLGGRSNDTPTKRSVSRPSHGPANVLRGVQDAQKSAQPSSSRLITPASQGRRSPYSPSSSPESTALRRPPVVRRSMADKSINLMAFATPASASVSSSADTRSTSSSDIDSGLAGKMAHHNLLDMSMSSAGVDENSGMALEAMKNQADQAEQTATRLLEIATEEEEGGLTATLPPQGENASFAAHSPEATSALLPPAPLPQGTPTVPFNKSSSHLPQFEDSPMAPPKPRGSLLLGSRAIQDSWWLEKAKHARPASPMTLASAEDLAALSRLIDSLAHNTARPEDLRKLSSVSHDHPYSLSEEEGLVWAGDRRGSRLVEALLELLHSSETPSIAEAGMLLLKDLVSNQCAIMASYELQLFRLLLKLKQSSALQTSAAAGAILDVHLQNQDPLTALASFRSCLGDFKPSSESSASTSKSFSFGMKGLSTMFQQLPEEVLEDQIPLTGPLILEALNSKATDVRQAGIMVLVAAHRVIRDEQRLFNMFKTESGDGVLSDVDNTGESLGRSGLTDQQMALATYYFSKDDNNPLQ